MINGIRSLMVFCFLVSALISCSTDGSRNSGRQQLIYKKLQDLLDLGEYFRLESALKFYRDSIDSMQKLYFKAFLDNAFNRNDKAIKDVDSLEQDPKIPGLMK